MTHEWKRADILHISDDPRFNALVMIVDPSEHHQHAQYSVMAFVSTKGDAPKHQHATMLAYTSEEAHELIDDVIMTAYERALGNPIPKTTFHHVIATYVQGALL